jgi:tetratricopeptide (TPR) repeat protein
VDTRRLLQAAAVLGRSFPAAVLDRMRVAPDTEDALLEALRADLIREHRLEPIEYQFKHGLIREAVLSTLTAVAIKDLHRRAARAIELCFAPRLEEHVEALAEHYEAAGDHENAVEFIEGIAERLVSVYRYSEASHALDVCRRYLATDKTHPAYARITMRSAEIRGLLGRGREAAEQIDELLTLGRSSQFETQALLAMKAQVLSESGALDEAVHVIDQFNALGAHPRSPLVVCMAVQIHLRREALPAARAALEALGNIDDLSGDLAFAACSMWAGYLAKTGRFSEGGEWAARALDLAKQGGSVALTLRAERYFGVMKLLNGELSDAYSLLRRVWVSYQELGATIGEIETAINLVYAAELRGLLRVGWDIGKSTLDVAESKFWRAALSANLATTALELGDEKNARALAMEVLEADDEVPPFARFVALIALGDIHAGREEWQQAEHYVRIAMEETEDASGRRGQRVSALATISSLALRQCRIDIAKEHAQRAVASLPGSEKTVHVAAFRALGSAVGAVDGDAGRVHLERALGLSREFGMKIEEGRTLTALGAVVKDRSSSYFDRAQQLFEECEAERGLAELNELRQR